jgi:hypothetical protein
MPCADVLVGDESAVDGFDAKVLPSPCTAGAPPRTGAVCGRHSPLIEPCSGEVMMADNNDTWTFLVGLPRCDCPSLSPSLPLMLARVAALGPTALESAYDRAPSDSAPSVPLR